MDDRPNLISTLTRAIFIYISKLTPVYLLLIFIPIFLYHKISYFTRMFQAQAKILANNISVYKNKNKSFFWTKGNWSHGWSVLVWTLLCKRNSPVRKEKGSLHSWVSVPPWYLSSIITLSTSTSLMSSSDPNNNWIFRSCTLHSSSRLCLLNLFSSREVSRAVASLCNSVASLHAENAQNNSRVETSLLVTCTEIKHDKCSIGNRFQAPAGLFLLQ